MEVFQASVVVVGATAIILNLNRLAKAWACGLSRLEYVNVQLAYQFLLLGVALLLLIVLSIMHQANLVTFLAIGDIAAPARGVAWMGISEGESWRRVGTSLSFFVTMATAAFVYLRFRRSIGPLHQFAPFIPWALLFALTNSLSEEVVYRLAVIVPMAGAIDNDDMLLFSAVAFGAPHLRGMPNGLVGAVMAALLGWLLAKSVVETNGVFWAWLIHCLQDIVIFSALIGAAASESSQPTAALVR